MKKLLLSCIALLFCFGWSSAQVDVRYKAVVGGGTAGYIDSKVKNTWAAKAGLGADIQFNERPFFISTGLQLAKKGGKGDATNGNLKVDAYYLEIPIFARIEQPISSRLDHIKFFGALGPYLGLGVFGDTKWDSYTIIKKDEVGKDREVVIDAGSDSTFSSSQLRRFDVGMEASVGLLFNDLIEVAFSVNLGLTDTFRNSSGNNQTVLLSLGYLF